MHQKIRSLVALWLVTTFSSVFFTPIAHANWEILPDSYQQLYETYGLYIDRQNTLVDYGQARVWAAVGGELPIIGNPDSPSHPELTIIGTGNFGLYYTDNYRFYTQNIDARVGMGYQQSIDDFNRFEVSIVHGSAHTADGVVPNNVDVVSPGVGAETLRLRFVHDFERTARVGADYNPYLRSDPAFNRWVNLDLFGEYFPYGDPGNVHHTSPYIAAGYELYGPTGSVTSTYHVQLGLMWGNHFTKNHFTSLRTVLGFYSGADPRLKYFSLLAATDTFYYAGIMFDL